MSTLDGVQLLFYAVAMYAGGVIGDVYDQRKVLAVSYSGYAFCTIL